MSLEDEGQIKLFTLIVNTGENPLYPNSDARKQLAYQQAMNVGGFASKQVLEITENQELVEESSESNQN